MSERYCDENVFENLGWDQKENAEGHTNWSTNNNNTTNDNNVEDQSKGTRDTQGECNINIPNNITTNNTNNTNNNINNDFTNKHVEGLGATCRWSLTKMSQ